MSTENRGIVLPPQYMAILIVSLFSLLAVYAQFKQSYVLLAVIGVIPVGIMLFSRLDIVASLFIIFYFSQLYYYRLPMNLMLYQVMMIVFVGSALAKRIITKANPQASPNVMLGYLSMLWIVAIMFARGHSLSFLGSSNVGGARYIHIFLAFLVYLFSGYINLSQKQWKWAMGLMLAFIFVPVVCNLIIIFTHGKIWQPLLFVKIGVGLTDTFASYSKDVSTTRWSILHPVVLIYLLPAFLWPLRGKRNTIYYAFFFMLSAVAAFLSGYRNRVLHAISFFVLFAIFSSKKPWKTAMIAAVSGLLVLALLVIMAPYLPYGAQRVLTMVPGAQVSAEAEFASTQTVEWRKTLWGLVFEALPQYLLVGRGFGYNLGVLHSLEKTALQFRSTWRDAYTTFYGGHMHQGVLDMLLFLGVPGLVLLLLWWGTEMIRHIKLLYIPWESDAYKRYHLALTVYFIVCVSQFLTYLGNLQKVFPDLIFQLALLNALVVSDRSLKPKRKQEICCVSVLSQCDEGSCEL